MSEGRAWRRLPRVGRADVGEDVRAEVESHLQLQAADLVREGWSEAAAMAEARRRFGERKAIEGEMEAISRLRERDQRRAQWWDAVLQDVQYALRLVWRSPGFSAVVMLTLALGIGANTAVFSIVDAVLLRPLPYGDADRVMSVWSRYVAESGDELEWMTLSTPEVREYTAAANALSAVAAYNTGMVNLASGAAVPDRVGVVNGEANLFEVLRAPALIGRTFAPGEDAPGAACVVVLSYGLARERFATLDAAVGETMRVDGGVCEVIGVMPAGFFFPNANARLWRPLSIASETRLMNDRGSHWLRAVGRLAPGVSQTQAEAELAPLMQEWRRADDHHIGHFIVLRPFVEDVVGAQRPVLLLLLGAVGLVLLTICANLANLLLTRAEGRRREMAVRVALGAGQGRLARQLLTENLMLTACGGAVGVGVAWLLLRVLPHLGDAGLPGGIMPSLDARVLAFTAAVSVVTGLLFGMLPALQARAVHIQETLRSEGRGATAHGRTARVRRGLVVVEIALSVAVVSAAALLMRTYDKLRRIDVGFGAEPAVVLDVTLPATDYAETTQIAAFFTALRQEAASLPGVRSVGLVAELPLRATPGMDSFRIEGRPEPQPGEPSYNGGYVMATPGYFDAVGIPLVRGRGIEERDVRDAPLIAVIDERAAALYWPDSDPIGQRIRYYDEDAPWLTIVGIVGSVRYESPEREPRPAVYVAHAQSPRIGFYTGRAMTLVVRGAGAIDAVVAPVRAVVRRLDPQVPVTNVAMLQDVVTRAIGRPRFAGTLMSLFALTSLLVGALGVYGVLAYLVRARTQEIGVRMALGATAGSVQRMVLRQGLVLAAIGLVIGVAVSLLAGGVIRSMLYGISPADPLTLLIVGGVLTAVSFVASYLPARRATRIDPAAALRSG